MSSQEVGAARAQAPQLTTLPVELILEAVEARLAQVDDQLQSDIVSLRLTSKLLHKSATPHFYEVIQLRNPARIIDLVAQLQAQPDLCKTIRAVWWNDHEGREVHMKPPERCLVNLANVDEVAYWDLQIPSWGSLRVEQISQDSVGVHFALRDVGPWCQHPALELSRLSMEWIQGTPTLSRVYPQGSNEHLATISGAAQDRLTAEHPEIQMQADRAVWALHLAASQGTRLDQLDFLSQRYRTVTHLTVTLFRCDFDPFRLQIDIRQLFRNSRMPLLQHLVLRVVCSKTETATPPTIYQDPRLRIERIELPELLLEPREAMRNFAFQQWHERVFQNGVGPWEDPLTESVGPELPPPSGAVRTDDWNLYVNRDRDY